MQTDLSLFYNILYQTPLHASSSPIPGIRVRSIDSSVRVTDKLRLEPFLWGFIGF